MNYIKKKLIGGFISGKSLLLLMIFTVFSVHSEESDDYPIPERIQKIEQFLKESEAKKDRLGWLQKSTEFGVTQGILQISLKNLFGGL